MPQRIVLFLNGPNLNMLGTRQPDVGGYVTLDDLEEAVMAKATSLGVAVDFRQSNSETELITWIQEARATAAGIVINPAAYAHSSVAMMDALLAFKGPIVELHLSNNARLEDFRRHSYIARAATAVIEGFGPAGYELALEGMHRLLEQAA